VNELWWHFAASGVETWLWLPPLVAAGISFFTSMLGISGAFLLLPLQVSLLGFAGPSASATNLVFNLIAIPGGVLRYQREGRLLWPLALSIVLGSAPGVVAGAWVRTHWLAEQRRFEPFVAAVLLFLAWRLLAGVRAERNSGHLGAEAPVLTELGWGLRAVEFALGGTRYRVPLPGLLGISTLVGLVGTAYGIGGGSLMVPLCLTWCRLPVHAIAGATLAATFATSVLALAAYQWLPAPPGVAAAPDWALGTAFGLGGLVGAYLGARCQRHVPQAALRVLLALILLGLAVHYL
jgi:uncharacterized protein